jgi:hypothetical protein
MKSRTFRRTFAFAERQINLQFEEVTYTRGLVGGKRFRRFVETL